MKTKLRDIENRNDKIEVAAYYIPPSSRVRVAWKCPYCGLTDYKEIFFYNKKFEHICVGKCKRKYTVICSVKNGSTNTSN